MWFGVAVVGATRRDSLYLSLFVGRWDATFSKYVNKVQVGHMVIKVLLFQWCMSQTINGFDDVKFEAASVLADLFEAQGQPSHSKPILRKAIELSQHSVYWHCRLIFQLAVSKLYILCFMSFVLYYVVIVY